MSFYIIPAVIALMIKIAVLFAAGASQKSARVLLQPNQTPKAAKNQLADNTVPSRVALGVFTTMVLIMAGHNLAELLGYLEFASGTFKDGLMRWYYLMTVGSLSMIVLYAKTVSGLDQRGAGFEKVSTYSVLLAAITLSAMFMFTDLLVSGAHSIGYSMTADHGPYYWLFQAFSLISFIVILAYLIFGYARAESHQTEIQCGYTLFALAPIVLTSLSLLVLMKMGFQVNAALVMPLATAAFLLITLKGERVHGILDVRRHIPLSLERKTSAQIMDIFSQYSQDSVNYRDALNEIEKLLVTHKHQKHGGNVSSTAASMELPRSSLYSIFRRLEIDLKDEK